ncbi:nuclear transport factor 2 family protein [Sphingomonas sp.]|uniref:nuclear transport factor 2 family protein n=1 Tax=Sphingomonas sp. TaxID=28214 RepID=UPI003D6CD83C
MFIPLLIAAAATATNVAPADAVARYAEAIEASSPSALARAFQPSAIMYCTNNGVISATSQAQWKTRLAGTPRPASSSTRLEWLDAGETTAVARVQAVRGDRLFIDYLLLARIGADWRIVGKLCQAGAREDGAGRAAADRVIDMKLEADRTWDDRLLGTSIDPRALIMTVEEGEFVAATSAEWQARYRDRKRTSSGNTFDVTSRIVESRGDIAIARWSFRSASGDWTDRALLMRTPDGWRMMALVFSKEKP